MGTFPDALMFALKEAVLDLHRKLEHDAYAEEGHYPGIIIGEKAIRALEPDWCWYDYSRSKEHLQPDA